MAKGIFEQTVIEYARVVHKTMLLLSNKSLVVYLCRHLDILIYEVKTTVHDACTESKLGVGRKIARNRAG